jgi:hypothetical protein
MSTMRTRSMANPTELLRLLSMEQTGPLKLAELTAALKRIANPPLSSEYFHKGFDNESDPKTIAGFSIPTTAAGWTEQLDEIEAFVEACKKRIMNNERITDVTMLNRYLNFINVLTQYGVAWRYGLYAKDNFPENARKTFKLQMDMRHLNELV